LGSTKPIELRRRIEAGEHGSGGGTVREERIAT
jgi:hypothetical protein